MELSMAYVEPVPRETISLRSKVIEHLRDAIVDGRLRPGQKLVERELCSFLDVSRTLLREVLQHLQAEGLITSKVHKGPSVAIIGAEEVGELYEVREVMEALLGKSFARHATDKQIQDLRDQLEQMRQADHNNTAELLILKGKFYAIMLEGCGNRVVGQVLTQLNNRMMLFRRLSMSAPGRVGQMFTELDGIVRAIEARDEDLAAKRCSSHVANAAATVTHQLEQKNYLEALEPVES
jgi:DNA-binding GntR family transcriptional regulator